jgi:hypothetical protein
LQGRQSRVGRLAAAAVVIVVAGVPAGSAVGEGDEGLSSVSVAQLQAPSQLPDTPDASVPVPDVPQVQVPPVPAPEVPDVPAPPVPNVQTPAVPAPSVPDVPTPSAPSTPQAPAAPSAGGSTGSSTPSAPAPAPADDGSPATAPADGEARGKAVAGGDASSAGDGPTTVRERRAARDRRVAAEVRRLRGCLDALGAEERSVLELRAGLDGGDPRSRAEVARELDISRADARGFERSGLRDLRTACGVPPQVGSFVQPVRRTASMPPLQPPPVLAARTSGRVFVSQDELAGEQEVKSRVETSPPMDDPDADEQAGDEDLLTPPPGTTLTLAAATTGSSAPLWIALACVLGLMAALALLAARGVVGRRPRTADAGRGTGVVAASAVAAEPVATTIPAAEPDRGPEAPAKEPGRGDDWQWPAAAATTAAAATAPGETREREREPEPESEPEPVRDATTAVRPTPVAAPTRRVRRDYARPAKLAARGASSAFSLAARELRRRRNR